MNKSVLLIMIAVFVCLIFGCPVQEPEESNSSHILVNTWHLFIRQVVDKKSYPMRIYIFKDNNTGIFKKGRFFLVNNKTEYGYTETKIKWETNGKNSVSIYYDDIKKEKNYQYEIDDSISKEFPYLTLKLVGIDDGGIFYSNRMLIN